MYKWNTLKTDTTVPNVKNINKTAPKIYVEKLYKNFIKKPCKQKGKMFKWKENNICNKIKIY